MAYLLCLISNSIPISGSNICVHPSQICDGLKDCLDLGDDELFCDYNGCPDTCTCYGSSVHCINTIHPSFLPDTPLSSLIGKGSTMIMSLTNYTILYPQRNIFQDLSNLKILYISNCTLLDVASLTLFNHLTKLRHLSLINTIIYNIPSEFFIGLRSLLILNVTGCHVYKLFNRAFPTVTMLTFLDLSNASLFFIEEGSFCDLYSLTSLNINNNYIKVLTHDTFLCLDNLNYLHITSNSLESIDVREFLFNIYTNVQSLCCYLNQDKLCIISGIPMQRKQLSNYYCAPLIDQQYKLQFLLLAAAIVVLLSNLIPMKVHLIDKKKKGRIYLINLAISDLTIGIYFLLLLMNDLMLSGNHYAMHTYLDNGMLCSYTGITPIFCIINSSSGWTLLTLKHLIATRYTFTISKHFDKIEVITRSSIFVINIVISTTCSFFSSVQNRLCFLPYLSTTRQTIISVILLVLYPLLLFLTRMFLYKRIFNYAQSISKIQTDNTIRRLNEMKMRRRITVIILAHLYWLIGTALVVILPLTYTHIDYHGYLILLVLWFTSASNINAWVYTLAVRDR